MQKDLEGKVRKNPASRLFAPLADVYRKNGKVDEAIALLERGLVRHPNYGSARVLLARCREDLGEWDLAREAWLNVLEGDPGSLVALRGLGEIAVWTGNRAEAARWFRRYLEEFPGDERVRARLGEVEVEVGPAVAPEASEGDVPLRVESGDAPAVPGADSGDMSEVGGSEPEDREDPVAVPGVEPGEGVVAEQEEDDSSPVGTGKDSLETTTLAEIYAQQGFYERALEIYRRIERQTPGNGRIRERIRTLEGKLAAPRGEAAARPSDGGESEWPGEASPAAVGDGGDGSEEETPAGSISINVAESSELESIPGVGPVIARKIVVERERNGPFADGRDMRRVPSLGRRLIERIEPYLTFDEIVGDEQAGSGEPRAAAGRPDAPDAPDREVGEERVDPAEVPETAGGEEEGGPGEDAEFEEFRRWLKNLRR